LISLSNANTAQSLPEIALLRYHVAQISALNRNDSDSAQHVYKTESHWSHTLPVAGFNDFASFCHLQVCIERIRM